MKIGIVIPLWRRREITEFCFVELRKLIEALPQHSFSVLCIISEDFWPGVCEEHSFKWLYYPNEPLGRKLNAGILMALAEEPDYIMTMNSDSVIRPELFSYYDKEFSKGTEYFGVDRLTILDSLTGKAKDYTYEFTVLGVAKLMKCEAIERSFRVHGCLYPDDQNRGLDNKMMDNLIRVQAWPVMVRYEGQLVFDVKSEVNIWPWEHFQNKGTEVKSELCYKTG